ncbi:hypothetical protein MYX82_14305 [Acidobacteria bacterium AH-259-D05]|nr:hypothetical protein [Acidobacteria bacterium AH-259-D05]
MNQSELKEWARIIRANREIVDEGFFLLEQLRLLKKAIPPLIAFYASFGHLGVRIAHRSLRSFRRDIRALTDGSFRKVSLEYLDECFLSSCPIPRNLQRPYSSSEI